MPESRLVTEKLSFPGAIWMQIFCWGLIPEAGGHLDSVPAGRINRGPRRSCRPCLRSTPDNRTCEGKPGLFLSNRARMLIISMSYRFQTEGMLGSQEDEGSRSSQHPSPAPACGRAGLYPPAPDAIWPRTPVARLAARAEAARPGRHRGALRRGWPIARVGCNCGQLIAGC